MSNHFCNNLSAIAPPNTMSKVYDKMADKIDQLIESIDDLTLEDEVLKNVIDLDLTSNNFFTLFQKSYDLFICKRQANPSKDFLKQEKLCLLQWNNTSHKCDLDKLITYFEQHKPKNFSISFSKITHLLGRIHCLSKLPEILRLFEISNDQGTLYGVALFIEELIEIQEYNRAIILLEHFNIRHMINFCNLLLKLLFEVS